MSARENAISLYMKGIRDGHPREAVEAYTGARYTQHSTGVKDGKDGFVEFFEPFIEHNHKREMNIVRAIQDGRHVFIHCFQNINDGEAKWVTTDFFDSDDEGKIIEHWDVISSFEGENAAGHTQVDGDTEIRDLDKTNENRKTVQDFLATCFIAGRLKDAGAFLDAESFVRHSAGNAVDWASLEAEFNAQDNALSYQENVLTVAEGNFVATLNRARRGDAELCQVDLFRLADGKIVEHWDNCEPVPPASELANSGKF